MKRKVGKKALVSSLAAITLFTGVAVPYNAFADNAPVNNATTVNQNISDFNLPAPKHFITDHETTINGNKIEYQVDAGETYLYNLKGQPTASMFSYSYIKKGNDENRPVLFIFNGGPGSPSFWLQMGIYGPRKVQMSNDVNPKVTPPFPVVANENSLLDVADLVFIDPIGTGYSKTIGVGKDSDFFGVDEDADSIAQFIETWLTKNGRWNSPKYLSGESYGSKRAAVLSNALMGGPLSSSSVFRGISLNGIILLGTIMKDTNPEDLMASALNLPVQASTAWYHKVSGYQNLTLANLDEKAYTFAKDVYYPAIVKEKENKLSVKERKTIVNQLIKYTGLPESAFKKSIVLSNDEFSKQVLAKTKKNVGIYDSRYTLPSVGAGFDPVADDPAMGQYSPAFIAAFHQMQKNDLGVNMDRPYNTLVWKGLNFGWNNERKTLIPKSDNYANELAEAMRRNPDLKVMVASGYYDMGTTQASARNAFEESATPKDRVFFKNYESGHMLYIGQSADQFSKDAHEFIKSGTATK